MLVLARRPYKTMKKKLSDFARSLNKKIEQTAGSEQTTCQQLTPRRRNSLEWQLVEALQKANPNVDALLNEAPTVTKRLLLEGIRDLWKGDWQAAEKKLTQVSTQADGIGRCWAHIHLGLLGLEEGRYDFTDAHICRARRYAYEDRYEEHFLPTYVDLIEVQADLDRGVTERLRYRLESILETCPDTYLQAMASYLVGTLFRYGVPNDYCRQVTSQALVAFEQMQNRYFVALCQLNLSYLLKEVEEASSLAGISAVAFETLGRTREAALARNRLSELKYAQTSFERVGDCLFISPLMKAIRIRLNAIACNSSDPILILGPRGSGKEALAQAIHLLSPRAKGPFLAVNCGALPDTLVESELFGYEKGAFTGATTQKKGLFEMANGGTIFLDEIGELPLQSQAKLLRVLQSGLFRRLGGTAELAYDARIIAATNKDLDEMVIKGDFRADLLDRICVWRLRLPPLSKRKEDIIPLAEEFLRRQGQWHLDSSAKRFLYEKEYPGNVRSLENDVRRAVAKARALGSTVITASLLADEPEDIPHYQTTERLPMHAVPNYEQAMLAFERNLLLQALAACSWNKKLASVALGLPERTFWRAIQRHGLYGKPEMK